MEILDITKVWKKLATICTYKLWDNVNIPKS